jgi:superfamily I DNA/RNA helicase
MTADSKVYLVHGPPGTGKTTHLARQCELAVERHGRDGVMIASLTRTAAHEIASRVDLAEDQTGTLHAHCYRALDRPELVETAKGLREWNSAHPELAVSGATDQLEDTPVDVDAGSDGQPGDRLHQQVMNHRARLTPVEAWTPEQQAYFQAWQAWKGDRLDFTDLIERAAEGTITAPYAPEVLLIDEAQDLSALELKLTAHWARHAETTVFSGDTDQALYSWRGSSPRALLDLEHAGERVLSQSYRVPAAVHDVAASWIRQLRDRPDIDYHPTEEPGSAVGVDLTLRDVTDLEQLVDELAGDGGTVMVLTSCGYMLNPLVNQLKANGRPFHNPYRAKAGGWNPLRAAGRLLAFLRPDERVWGEHARAWTWRDLQKWAEPLKASDAFARGAKTEIDAQCDRNRFGETQADQEVPLEDLMRLFDARSLHHPAIRLSVDWWERNLRASQASVQRFPLAVYRKHGGTALRDTPGLIVGTAHSVKGGEVDHVIVAPDLSGSGMAGWIAEGDARDHIVRTFYVAITRARRSLTVLRPSGWTGVPIADYINQLQAA